MASLSRISHRAFTNLALHHPNPGIVSCFYTSRHSIATGRIDFAEDEAFVKKTYTDVSESPSHFKKFLADPDKKTEQSLMVAKDKNEHEFTLPHPIWSHDEADSVKITHRAPKSLSDRLAYFAVMTMRTGFDLGSGYTIGRKWGTLDERSVLIRCIFLETVAGVPGFAAAMIRHLHSLRKMQRDSGWIHTLLEEAENERMHLMTFMELKKPGPIFKYAVVTTQFFFTMGFSFAYLISPNFCHRFVGYLEEQAVITYTHILEELDSGNLPMWSKLPAPDIAIQYWELGPDAMMRDVILAIRADEAHHRLVNHTLGSMKLKDQNPFKPGE